MLQRLRNRAQGQEGFTLIELLVVILIIGILAAVAIPTFLSQTHKATDSNVQSAISSAQTAEATYQTNNNAYTAASGTASSNPLIQIEPTLSKAFGAAPNGYAMTVTLQGTTGYTIKATGPTSNVAYTMVYVASTGTVTDTCTPDNTADCSATGTWGSSVSGS